MFNTASTKILFYFTILFLLNLLVDLIEYNLRDKLKSMSLTVNVKSTSALFFIILFSAVLSNNNDTVHLYGAVVKDQQPAKVLINQLQICYNFFMLIFFDFIDGF